MDHSKGWDQTVDSAVLTALLLTGDFALAERAVLEAIESSPAEALSPESLAESTIAAALRTVTFGDEHLGAAALPVELRRVFQLHPEDRLHFVLRMLAGWPAERTARALHSDPEAVNLRIGQACLQLAMVPTLIEVGSGPSLSR